MSVVVFPLDAVSGAPNYTGEMLRQSIGALVAKGTARPIGGITGVTPGMPTSTLVTATATGNTWTVNPFTGIVDLETSATAGPYEFAVGSVQTGSITPPNATNPRIDLMYFQLSDPAEGDGTTTPQGQVLYLAGTAAPSPTVPATPARSMALATIAVPANATGALAVTWVAPFTSAAGGIVPATGSSLYPGAPYVGQYVDDSSLGGPLRYNGSAWIPVGQFRYRSRVWRTGAWTVANPITIFGFDSVSNDPAGLYNTSTHQWTVPFAGTWRVFCQLACGSSASGQRILSSVYQNGSQVSQSTSSFSSATSQALQANSYELLSCNAGDTVAIYQLGTSGLTGTTGPGSVYGILEWAGN